MMAGPITQAIAGEVMLGRLVNNDESRRRRSAKSAPADPIHPFSET